MHMQCQVNLYGSAFRAAGCAAGRVVRAINEFVSPPSCCQPTATDQLIRLACTGESAAATAPPNVGHNGLNGLRISGCRARNANVWLCGAGGIFGAALPFTGLPTGQMVTLQPH